VLIYLPRGPSGNEAERDASNVSILRSEIPHPIVQINYRLSEHYQYPTPIHDVLCGFDWIVEYLLPKRGITRVGRSEFVGQMAVCGELIGGSLATALALTECRIGQPGIVAAAVSNPLVDWVSIENVSQAKKGQTAMKESDSEDSVILSELQRLRYLRGTLFKRPEGYFDPFASPILFFRSAGVGVPPPSEDLPIDDLEQLSMLERAEYYRQQVGMTDGIPTSSNGNSADTTLDSTMRKASRRFPSKALGLRLPQFHISTGNASPLRNQADELARVLRQSHVRQSKSSTPGFSDFGRKILMEDELEDLDDEQRAVADKQKADAKKKVELHGDDGTGSWSDTSDGVASLSNAARWLKDKLG
jgi:acetyl esterase/lipase